MNKNEKSKDIFDIKRFFLILKDKWVKIIFCGIVLGVLSLLISFFAITPKYEATIDLLVNQKSEDSNAEYTTQQADLQAINTYKDVLQKPIVLASVLKEAKQKNNYQGNIDTLKDSIEIENETSSQLLSVTVSDDNAYTAADIANSIGKIFTKKITKIMKVDNVTVVTRASADTKQVSPNVFLNTIIGFLFGILLGVIFYLAKELLDKSIHGTEFLAENLGLTNLGTVYHLKKSKRKFGTVTVINEHKGDEKIENRRRV
ncbi:YveK family protein [Ligilactobacillus pobuzihii]|uniref:Capsular polysaccharide biosynthesis protein CpsC n=1 Tax=Ligilactobacillus pobuzihii TaxID=449659 RepID=A0A0R2LIT5_9LACO|nr:Wzz/FepE/Etk N-terminal domain-containing protein [Ligilactobacillus pobuzihii]KRK09307.1 Exopolysaccharide chain length regulator [Ligilactobacillus pobuzihii E100301 = KCTC 13174]KRO01319.1 Exopolysaccharide chain length regulator [Ligilactobacillus pobuzihii]GEN49052.1 chain-length determining protein [Ligilactobacillus pobuzihii]